MTKTTKPKITLKPIITLFSALALCCSTVSYAGYDKTQDSVPASYWVGDESEAVSFDQEILNNSHYFVTNLALRSYAKNIYHALHDVKQHHFQRQQIALMHDVLSELKAVNKNLTDRLATSKSEEPHQKFKRLSDEINKYEMNYSGAAVSLIGFGKFGTKNSRTAICKMLYPNLSENSAEFAECINSSKLSSNSNETAKPPIGTVKEAPKSMEGESIADYYTAKLAKNWITELAMKPKLKAMDDYYIDANGLKKSKLTLPEIKAGDGSLEWVNPPNFNFVSGDALALAQEIFNRKSFQDEIAALIQQEIRKVTPPSTNESKTSDHDNGIDMVTGGYDFNGAEYVRRN